MFLGWREHKYDVPNPNIVPEIASVQSVSVEERKENITFSHSFKNEMLMGIKLSYN